MSDLEGKVAVITGGAGGVGAATATRLLASGAAVVVVDSNAEQLAEVEASLVEDFDRERVVSAEADVSSAEEVEAAMARARTLFGGVDIVIANAGTEGRFVPLTELSTDAFDALYATNVRGAWLTLKYGFYELVPRGGGSVILTSSVAGKVGAAGLGAYAMTKHALIGLARSAALEMAPFGIRVNAVCPGPVDNRMMRSIERQAVPGAQGEARQMFREMIPLGRYATNDEVAAMIHFLASDESSFCTGGAYDVDGGFLAR